MNNLISNSTKETIQSALLELLINHSIEQITVKQIAEQAFISRVHFYNYFTDKYDVLRTIKQQFLLSFKLILAENTDYLKNYEPDSEAKIHELLYLNALKNIYYIKEHHIHIQLLIKNDSQFLEEFYASYYDHFLTAIPRELTTEKHLVMINYMTHGVFHAVFEVWLADDCQETPEKIAVDVIDLLMVSFKNIYKKNDK